MIKIYFHIYQHGPLLLNLGQSSISSQLWQDTNKSFQYRRRKSNNIMYPLKCSTMSTLWYRVSTIWSVQNLQRRQTRFLFSVWRRDNIGLRFFFLRLLLYQHIVPQKTVVTYSCITMIFVVFFSPDQVVGSRLGRRYKIGVSGHDSALVRLY